jgi:CheY-like chemotaxis protein
MTWARWATLALTAALIATTPLTASSQERLVGQFRDWTAYVHDDDGDKVCYIVSEPVEAKGDYTRRGDTYLIVSHNALTGLPESMGALGSLLERFLASRGYDVSLYGDGASALRALRAEAFDVALLDIVMPEMDGLEVLRQIREEPTPPEVIIITGNGTIETAITAMKLGAYDYLGKPYRMAEIEVRPLEPVTPRNSANDAPAVTPTSLNAAIFSASQFAGLPQRTSFRSIR